MADTTYFETNNGRKKIKWKKEKTFKCPKDAEEAISLEGMWTKYYYNNDHNGVKTYYRCNQVKLHPKQCSAGISLHYECASNNVHLYRKEAEHDHGCKTVLKRVLSPNVKKEVQRLFELNFKPKDIIIELSNNMQFEFANKTLILNYIHSLRRKKSFDTTLPQFEFISTGKDEDTVVDNFTGNTNISKRKLWNKEKTFQNSKEAEDAVQIEQNWIIDYKCSGRQGLTIYYRCNQANIDAKQCPAKIFLFYDSASTRVYLYRRDAEHDHDDRPTSNLSISETIKEEATLFDIHIKSEPLEKTTFGTPSETQSHTNIQAVQHKNLHITRSTQYESNSSDDNFTANTIESFVLWNKERSFESPKDAEEVLQEEGIWSKHDSCFVPEGMKIFFKCNQGKCRLKECPAGVFLLYDSESNQVHLYRKEAEHDHDNKATSSNSFSENIKEEEKEMPELNLKPGNLFSDPLENVAPFEYENPKNSANSIQTLSPPNEDSIGQDEKLVETSTSYLIKPKPNMWKKEKTFVDSEDAEKAVRIEGIWSKYYKNRVKNGLKVYYRCNRVYKKVVAKECSAKIFLFYESVSNCVHLYRKDAEHDHNKEQEEKKRSALNLRSETSSIVTSPNVTVENLRENNNIHEIPQNNAFDTILIESDDDAEPTNQNRIRNNKWNKEKTFESLKDAEEAVRLEGVWSKYFKNMVQNGEKTYYRCNQVKFHGKQCAAKIFLFYDRISTCVHLYRTEANHDHQDHNSTNKPSRGIHNSVKRELQRLLDLKIKPKSILKLLAKNKTLELPSKNQLYYYIQKQKKK